MAAVAESLDLTPVVPATGLDPTGTVSGVAVVALAPVSVTVGVLSEFAQRIYDTGLMQYVTYTSVIDTAPDPLTTTPNHTGNLDVSTHEIL
jgi:hypothetical protein